MSEELVAAQGTAITAAPQHREGFERMDIDTVTMPTARLLQPISKEVADESYADYNFKAGNIIHSLLLEKLSDTFVPLLIWDDKICFVPKQEAEKAELKAKILERFGMSLTEDDMKSSFVCRAADNRSGDRLGDCANCKLCDFDGSDAPYCTKNINVLALFDGQELPVVIRFSATSHKHGRNFKNLAYYAGGNLYDRLYKLTSTKKTDKGNTWYELTVKPAGKVGDEELKVKAKALHDQFLKMSIEVAEEPVPEGQVQSEF
jgi:hypothetical protein